MSGGADTKNKREKNLNRRIFGSILTVAVVVLLATLVLVTGFLYDYFTGVLERQMRDEWEIAAAAITENGTAYLDRLTSTRYRLTVVAADGSVLCDTQSNAEAMENHADREEIRNALAGAEGKTVRYSATRLEKTIYYARRLPDGTVLRISQSQATVGSLLLGMLSPFLAILVAALILSFVLGGRLSRRIVEPLNTLDLAHPLENNAYEELSPLLLRIEGQHRQIDAQMRELKRRTDEFSHITANLHEGLVLLDAHTHVVHINAAARTLFAVGEDCTGADLLTIDRTLAMRDAIRQVQENVAGYSEWQENRQERSYRFTISRIDFDGECAGYAILAFDITDEVHAEEMRREFTANVSHELKTPLQGILGSAELIQSGMIKPEDTARFVGHIHEEATRLLALIGDIIRLSQLDEAAEGGELAGMTRESVDLYTVSTEVIRELADAAAKRNVTFTLSGGSVVVPGVRRLVYEVIYNLCDNAIRYNRDNGSVTVTVSAVDGMGVVSVADTGIGIAPENRDRIFERFYRVDKSHSRATGGTGLGLSIVKHAIQYLHGRIALDSRPGIGSTFTVSLPQSDANGANSQNNA